MKVRKLGRISGQAAMVLLCLLALLGSSLPVQAGSGDPPRPQMIQDIREGANGSAPEELAVIGATLFFSANDGASGRELWRTAPPYTSAQRVADICAGSCSSEPGGFLAVGATLLFSANDGDHGFELWRSEPPYTPATTHLVADINPIGNSSPAQLIQIGTAVFFHADDGEHGFELWRTDQPFTSAALVEDIYPGSISSTPREMTRIGWMLFFAARDESGTELWRSDPPYSAASTQRVVDLNKDGSAEVGELTAIGLNLFFSATDGESGQELWVIDSPYNEARRVTDIAGDPFNSNPNGMLAVGDNLFFTAWIGISGYELFRSEPPYDPLHTYLVDDISDSMFGSLPDEKVAIGTTLFFTAQGVDGRELYRTQPPYVPDTTDIVEDINPGTGSASPRELTPVGSTLFFTACDPRNGCELWKSEPPYNEAGTQIAFDLIEGDAGSAPYSLTAVDRTLFFGALSPHQGLELFRFGGAYSMPDTGFAPARISVVGAQPADKAYRALGTLELEIPALGVREEIVGVPVSADGWGLDWLGSRLGYLDGTAFPGWVGNSVLTGHATLADGTQGPFAGLGRLRYGDRLLLRSYGEKYTYEVRAVETITADGVDAVFRHQERAWLTLVTCKDFDEQTGSYRSRLLVQAVLVKVEAE